MIKNNILNNDQIKSRNRLAVLNLLKDQGAMSRSELTSHLSCDGTTVTNIVRSLTTDGFIKSLGCATAVRGRPKELIGLNENACRAIGVSLSPRMLCGAVVNFTGETIFQEKVHLEKNVSRETFKARFIKLASSLHNQVGDRQLLGLGLATFGIYDQERKIITNAEYFAAACGHNFESILSEEFNIIPNIMDGTNAMGIAEIWRRKNALPSSFILLNADIGIGCFIFADSRPLLTDKGAYNEFGHIIVNPDGPRCELGHCGCLETYASIPAIERQLRKTAKGDEISFDEILKKYRENDPGVMLAATNSAKWLGIATANLINLFAPREIVLDGAIAQFGERYLDILRDTASEYAIKEFSQKTSFSVSKLGEDGPARGAAIALLNNFFTQPS